VRALRASVVIPTYNRAALVRRAVDSALRAISPGDEVIVVDDGSTDDTEAALAPIRDRIRFVAAPHRGAGAARNRGIAEADADIVAFLDSDDEWTPDHLAVHRAIHVAFGDIAFSFSDFMSPDSEGNIRRRHLSQWHNDPRPWSELLSPGVVVNGIPVHVGSMSLLEMTSDFIPTFTMVARRRALPDTTWFAEDVQTFEDLQCFGRLALAGPAAFIDRETATQYGHPAARLTDAPALAKVEARLRILERIWGTDAAFVMAHGDAYRERLREQHVVHARCLLKAGRTSEARVAIRKAGRSPFAYRLLSWMPGPLVRGIDKTRDFVRR
jgi:glycosyltransferase involved in cell wall biosynthesis